MFLSPACCAQGIDVTGLPHVPKAPAPAAAVAASSAAAAQPVPYSQRKASPPAPVGSLAKMPPTMPAAKPAAAAAAPAPAPAPAAAALE